MNDPVCALCLRPVRVWRDIVFRRDGGIEHVKCPKPLHKRLHLVRDPVEPHFTCPQCSQQIIRGESVEMDGDELFHLLCWQQRKRPLSGGRADLPWALVFDEHVGRRRGLTPDGHAALLSACADTCTIAVDLRVRARRAIDQTHRQRQALLN